MSLRFCLVTTFYPPYNFGGDGLFVQRLAEALVRRGHTVDVVHDVDAYRVSGGVEPREVGQGSGGIKVHRLRGGSTLGLLGSHQLGKPIGKRGELKKILESGSYDVIHFHNVSLMGGPGVLRLGNALKVCTMHDYWFVCATHVLWRMEKEACDRRTCIRCTLHSGRPPQWWRYLGRTQRATPSIAAFITGSAFARDTLHANGFKDAIHVIPHFVPDEDDIPESSDHAERPFVLYAGRLETLKGPQTLIPLFLERQDVDLVIAGTGSIDAQLQKLAGGNGRIRFVGWQTQSQLRQLYRAASAVIVPSLCYETFGLSAVEAFARSTPVIARNFGALPEIVHHGLNGFLYQDDDGLRASLDLLLADSELRKRLGEQGRSDYENRYSEKRHMELYFELLQRHDNRMPAQP